MQRDELRQEIANKIPLSEYDGTKVSPPSHISVQKNVFFRIYSEMTQFRILMPPIVPVKEKGEGIKNKLTFSSDRVQ